MTCGLRDYGIEPQVWDDLGNCPGHVWGNESFLRKRGSIGDKSTFEGGHQNQDHQGIGVQQGQFCQRCNSWLGSLGLESDPMLFVRHIVEIFRECRRVLRDDGVLWINFGDSYMSSPAPAGDKKSEPGRDPIDNPNRRRVPGLKPKDMCGIPWMVASALRTDGWWLRSALPWVKRSAMPSSTKDRPANALEYMFMLTKSQHCYFDMEAIKIKSSPDTHRRYARGRSDSHKYSDGGPGNQTIARSMEHMASKQPPGPVPGVTPKSAPAGSGIKANESFHAAVGDLVGTRNFRNTDLFYQSIEPPHGLIWAENKNAEGGIDIELLGLDVNPKGLKAAHFASFAPKLIEPLILAGSPVMCCPDCGTGWERIVEKDTPPESVYTKTSRPLDGLVAAGTRRDGVVRGSGQAYTNWKNNHPDKTSGFRPACDHYDDLYRSTTDFPESHNSRKRNQRSISGDHYDRSRRRPGCEHWKTVPAMVLDIFGGAATSAIVAQEHGRNFTIIELSEKYLSEIAIPRITDGTGFSRPVERFVGLTANNNRLWEIAIDIFSVQCSFQNHHVIFHFEANSI